MVICNTASTKGSWYVSCDSETVKSLETGKRYSYKSVTVMGCKVIAMLRLALFVGAPISAGFYVVDAVSMMLRLPFLM